MSGNSAKKPRQRSANARRGAYHPRFWWFEHYHAWQSSGLSKSDYCKQHGINRSSFANWTRRFDQEQPAQLSSSESPPAFFEIAPSSKQLTTQKGLARSVSVNDITVAFDQPLDAAGCLSWIRALQSC
jgi:hypothetical protein